MEELVCFPDAFDGLAKRAALARQYLSFPVEGHGDRHLLGPCTVCSQNLIGG